MPPDILICAVPARHISRLPAALSILKACVQSAGMSARTVDFNLEFLKNQCGKDHVKFEDLSKPFEPRVEFTYTPEILSWLDDCIAYIKNINPRWLGISVETPYQHRATILLAQRVREQLPNIKIVLGAYGLKVETQASLQNFPMAKSIDLLNMFDQFITKHQLADQMIYGDAESAIVELLSEGLATSLFPSTKTSFSSPTPDFDDYDLKNYVWHATPSLPVTGSKSCVRACTFCSIPHHFGRFRTRTGEQIAREMIELKERYNINRFEFTDSLVNGSQSVFTEWVKIIAKYNQERDPVDQITWLGQYICKPQKIIDPGLYALIKQSGVACLIIGAESGSDEVLKAMNKKITVKDILDELEQFDVHRIQTQFLMLDGFYNETWERYVETLEFIACCHKYIASGTITRIAMGLPLHIENGIALNDQADELNIVLDPDNIYNWTCTDNPDNTLLERIRRRVITQVLLNKMSVPLTANGIGELKNVLEQLKVYEQKLRTPSA